MNRLISAAGNDIILQTSLRMQRDHFRVQRVESQRQQQQAEELVTRLYQQRGYATAGIETKAAAPIASGLPQLTTLIACDQQRLLGTLSVAIDSTQGLQADQLYPEQLAAYRREGRLIGEFSRLAMDPEHSSKAMLGALFHLACVQLGPLNGVTDVVIEVNPRHAGFYQRNLGFERIGAERICPRVNAPAVLLHLEFAHVARQVRLLGGSAWQSSQRSRSLYAYFFSQQEEDSLLQGMIEQRQKAASSGSTVFRPARIRPSLKWRESGKDAEPLQGCGLAAI